MPSARGRGAAPLDLSAVSRITLACICGTLAKDCASTVLALYDLGLSGSSREVGRRGLSNGGAMADPQLAASAQDHGFGAAFEEVLAALAADTLFAPGLTNGVRHPLEGDFLLVEIESRFWAGVYQPFRARIETGNIGVYRNNLEFCWKDWEVRGVDEGWTRGPHAALGGTMVRVDRCGLGVLEGIASVLKA